MHVGASQIRIDQNGFFPHPAQPECDKRSHYTFADSAFSSTDRPYDRYFFLFSQRFSSPWQELNRLMTGLLPSSPALKRGVLHMISVQSYFFLRESHRFHIKFCSPSPPEQ